MKLWTTALGCAEATTQSWFTRHERRLTAVDTYSQGCQGYGTTHKFGDALELEGDLKDV